MKKVEVIFSFVVGFGLLFGGNNYASATLVEDGDIGAYATPVYASISSPNDQFKGSSISVTKQISWGGGGGSYYDVQYYDGNAVTFYNPAANYYTTSAPATLYSLGSLSTQTWYTNLRVSNMNSSDTVYGSIKLIR